MTSTLTLMLDKKCTKCKEPLSSELITDETYTSGVRYNIVNVPVFRCHKCDLVYTKGVTKALLSSSQIPTAFNKTKGVTVATIGRGRNNVSTADYQDVVSAFLDITTAYEF